MTFHRIERGRNLQFTFTSWADQTSSPAGHHAVFMVGLEDVVVRGDLGQARDGCLVEARECLVPVTGRACLGELHIHRHVLVEDRENLLGLGGVLG